MRDALRSFVAGPAPVVVEVGFDHGMVILDHARRFPDTRWLGIELRKRRVARAAPHAPPNCHLHAGDARAVLHAVLPDRSVDRVEVRFPTPATNPRHLLFTEGLVADLTRVFRPGGTLLVQTDVEGLYHYVVALLVGWVAAPEPPPGPVLSRRERVCRRDGVPVWAGCWRPG